MREIGLFRGKRKDNGDMDGIIAWQPLPEPFKEE